MQVIRQRFQNPIYMSGVVLIMVSLFTFCLPFFFSIGDGGSSLFLFNFIATGVFALIRLMRSKEIEKFERIHHTFLLLILSLISAYSLNREMNVFDESVDWFSGLLITFCLNYIAFSFFDELPTWARHVVSVVNGVSILSFFYLAAYLLPLYAMGILGSLLLGAGLHVFIPALFVGYGLILQAKYSKSSGKYWLSFCAGLGAALSIVIFYTISWSNAETKINRAYKASQIQSQVPQWVYVAQHLPNNELNKKILKTGLVYSVPNSRKELFSMWSFNGNKLGERKKHDPLIMLASAFSGGLDLNEEVKLNILRSQYNLRHEASERLWSGDNLSTDTVKTAVKIWPQCNLSYTEKTITVSNNRYGQAWWRAQEEGIYTFYLPEGAVVSSLSLWINGKEEKALLATKSNAVTAYNTVVGVERRDPSIVQWQEGNMVSVRVFPIFKNNSRIFKIGITSPLQRLNGKLRYSNINFKGPTFSDCKEEIDVDFEQKVSDFRLPASFISMANNQSYSRKGDYTPEWDLSINDPGLSGCAFNYNGNNYAMSPYHKQLYVAKMDEVYLDINQSWTREEFDEIVKACTNKNIYVYDNILTQLDDNNKEELWGKLHALNFSLFPIYAIKNPAASLLVTKSGALSPTADDLDNSLLMKQTRYYLNTPVTIKIFNLGKNLNPYLKFLKEVRIFQYDDGDPDILNSRINKGEFPLDNETDERIILHESDIIISKSPATIDGNGPDHIMRLYAYNHIMHKLGSDLIMDRPFKDSLVQEAAEANIVTPVSSLIVLESQADYDRFDIKKTDGLGNASMASKGAVPEPHEWALIFLVIGTILWLMYKRKASLAVK